MNEELEKKIKALGWAVMQLDNNFNFIAVDYRGTVFFFEHKPKKRELTLSWESGNYRRHFSLTVGGVSNWRDLCFSRADCEAWANENLTCKENLSVQFTREEIDNIVSMYSSTKKFCGGTTVIWESILAKCDQILKGAEK